MRKLVCLAGLAALLCLAVPIGFAKTPAGPKGGTIVIVFKDGHRQSFNLADIARVEFPVSADMASESAPTNPGALSRWHFLGKWEVGDGSGNNFYITLYEDGQARKSMGNAHGTWVYVDGEARVTWDDGWHDAIRKVGSRYQKFAYGEGKSFTDTPDNVTGARNTEAHPI